MRTRPRLQLLGARVECGRVGVEESILIQIRQHINYISNCKI